jgi:hypothetical protein
VLLPDVKIERNKHLCDPAGERRAYPLVVRHRGSMANGIGDRCRRNAGACANRPKPEKVLDNLGESADAMARRGLL